SIPSSRANGADTAPPYTGPHGGLRRPRPLPRALREPLPPRLPGEIQGLPARRALVAPEPAHPARGLPARLRRHLPEPQDTAVPAVPPRGPRVLDLLRNVDAVGGAVADRLRRAGQEGAFPAPARGVLDGGDAGRHVRRDGGHPRRAL